MGSHQKRNVSEDIRSVTIYGRISEDNVIFPGDLPYSGADVEIDDAYPGIVLETLEYSWSAISYETTRAFPELQDNGLRKVITIMDIDESPRAQLLRALREQDRGPL
jgi:hypothetical protein